MCWSIWPSLPCLSRSIKQSARPHPPLPVYTLGKSKPANQGPSVFYLLCVSGGTVLLIPMTSSRLHASTFVSCEWVAPRKQTLHGTDVSSPLCRLQHATCKHNEAACPRDPEWRRWVVLHQLVKTWGQTSGVYMLPNTCTCSDVNYIFKSSTRYWMLLIQKYFSCSSCCLLIYPS